MARPSHPPRLDYSNYTIPGTTRKKSSGSGTGSTQRREYNWGATWWKSSGSCLENREYGRRDPSRWPRGTLCSQKLSITSPTSVDRSVGIVRSRTQTMEFFFVLQYISAYISVSVREYLIVMSHVGNQVVIELFRMVLRRIIRHIISLLIFKYERVGEFNIRASSTACDIPRVKSEYCSASNSVRSSVAVTARAIHWTAYSAS
jgi:hypothetical protein